MPQLWSGCSPKGTLVQVFAEQIVILNPNGSTADITITYYLGSGSPLIRTFALAPYSRTTINVNDAGLAGDNQMVSAKVESTNRVPIMVERPIYFQYQNAVDGGHTAIGYAPTI